MKKLTLMTTAALVALSIPAMADHMTSNNDHVVTHTRHMNYTNMNRTDMNTDQVVVRNQETDMQDRDNMQVQTQTVTHTEVRPSTRQEYTLIDGKRIIVAGDAVYLASASGRWQYPAPKGDYMTTNGYTIVSDDGVWLRTEGPPETVYVDVDHNNHTRVVRR